MKKYIIIAIAVAAVAIPGTLLVQHLLTASTNVPSAEKTSYAEVTAQLDEGGTFYMYLSTEKIIRAVDGFMDGLAGLVIAKNEPPEAQAEKKAIFAFIKRLFNDSGLFEISGIGMSSVPMGNGLNHDRAVIHHYGDKGNGLIWHLWGKSPDILDSLKLLPADTAGARFAQFDWKYLWEWIEKEAATSGIPKLAEAIGGVKPMLMTKGIDLDKLLASLAGKVGVVFTLDEGKRCQIPINPQTMLDIPDPSLALVLYVKDDSLFQLVQKLIPIPPVEEKGVKKIMGPILPLPITVQPMFVQAKDLLIIGSNGKIVDNILACLEGAKGLLTIDEFKKLAVDMPDQGNAFVYLSPRVFQNLFAIQKKIMAGSPDMDKEQQSALFRLNLLPQDLMIYNVMENTDRGIIFTSNNNLDIGSVVLLPAVVLAGVVSAVAVPNFLVAMEKGKQKTTMGDMRTLAMALESYVADNNQLPPGNTLADMKAKLEPFYIKSVPLKDAWGNDFLYKTGKDLQYCLASAGSDGVFAGWEQQGLYPVASKADFAQDIILCNATFSFGPK